MREIKLFDLSFVFMLCMGLLSMPYVASAATFYYVDASVGDDGNGGTAPGAGSAYRTLQKALSVVVEGDTIILAAGTYYPDEGPGQIDNDRDSTFDIPVDNLTIMGAGQALTILSGDLKQDDAPPTELTATAIRTNRSRTVTLSASQSTLQVEDLIELEQDHPTKGTVIDKAIIREIIPDETTLALDDSKSFDTSLPSTRTTATTPEQIRVFSTKRDNAYGVVTIEGLTGVAIQDLTISDGLSSQPPGGPRRRGSAIFLKAATALLDRTTIEENNGIDAAVFYDEGSLTVRNSLCRNNFGVKSCFNARLPSALRPLLDPDRHLILRIEDTIFENNLSFEATILGAYAVVEITGIRSNDSSTTEFRNNRSYDSAPAVLILGGLLHMDGVVVRDNESDTRFGAISIADCCRSRVSEVFWTRAVGGVERARS